MINKFSLYPFAAKPSDFTVGQKVQQLITSHYGSILVGVVVALHPSIDKVDVQWPHQVGRHSPEDLIPVTDALGLEPTVRPTVANLLLPDVSPEVTTLVGGVPSTQQVAVVTAHLKKLASVMKAAFASKSSGNSEVKTFTKVSSLSGDSVADEEIRLIVASLYDRSVASENAVYLKVIHGLIDA